MWPFNTGDCLIEVTAWAGLTVYRPVLIYTDLFIAMIVKTFLVIIVKIVNNQYFVYFYTSGTDCVVFFISNQFFTIKVLNWTCFKAGYKMVIISLICDIQ